MVEKLWNLKMLQVPPFFKEMDKKWLMKTVLTGEFLWDSEIPPLKAIVG